MTDTTNSCQKSFWVKSLSVSLFVHGIAFYTLFQHSWSWQYPTQTLFSSAKPLLQEIFSENEPSEKEQWLEEAFEELIVAPSSDLPLDTSFPSPSSETLSLPLAGLKPQTLAVEAPDMPFLESSFIDLVQDEQSLISASTEIELPSEQISLSYEAKFPDSSLLQLESSPPLLVEDHVLKSSSVLPIQEYTKDFSQPFLESSSASLLPTRKEFSSSLDSSAFFDKTHTHHSFELTSPIEAPYPLEKPLIPPLHFASIEEFLPEDKIAAIHWNDAFHLQVDLFPEDQGYVFSLGLIPKQDLPTERLSQNFYFLLDTSSQLEKHKLEVFKRSLLRALSCLQTGDTFNIFLLDKTITKLSPHSLPYSLTAVHAAEDFLESTATQRRFSSLDLFPMLTEAVEEIEPNEEMHTAILFTNGESSANFEKQQKQIRKYLDKNNGKVQVYVAAVGQNNNILYLDMISSLSGGKLLYSDTNASFPRKLMTLIKALRAPIAKDLMVSIRATDPKANISLLPTSVPLPALYNHEPFLIMGKIDRLCDLSFVIQGKHEEDWVYIQKKVHFGSAENADITLKKEWKIRQAVEKYQRFLQEPKGKHLKEAKELLKTAYGKAFAEQ